MERPPGVCKESSKPISQHGSEPTSHEKGNGKTPSPFSLGLVQGPGCQVQTHLNALDSPKAVTSRGCLIACEIAGSLVSSYSPHCNQLILQRPTHPLPPQRQSLQNRALQVACHRGVLQMSLHSKVLISAPFRGMESRTVVLCICKALF